MVLLLATPLHLIKKMFMILCVPSSYKCKLGKLVKSVRVAWDNCRYFFTHIPKALTFFITHCFDFILCYTITWHLCVFSLVVDRDLVKGHTQITSHPRHITSADFFFIPQNQRTTITSLDFVSYFFFIRCDVICDLLQYTRTRKNDIYLLNR